jgi:tryptophanyl-tRNA synthetase
MPSVTGIGLDQDPHARLTRDVMQRLSYPLEVPSFLYFSHQAGLNGNLKMSSSEPDNTIFLDDDEHEVKRKISRALTGGRNTSEEQKRLGGEPDKCMVYELYKYHFTDESRFNEIRKTCISGERTCGECKKECIVLFQKMLKEHQEKYKSMLSVAKEVVFGKKR